MTTAYTAIGRLSNVNHTGNDPVAYINGKEYSLNDQERYIYKNLCWCFLDEPLLTEVYNNTCILYNSTLEKELCIKQLIKRGLIVSATADTTINALIKLIENLFITPIDTGFLKQIAAFHYFMSEKGLSADKAKEIAFSQTSMSHLDKSILHLTKRYRLNVATIVNNRKLIKGKDNRFPIFDAITNLYLHKLIVFEKI